MTKKNILLPYENKWVAITTDNKKVLAADQDFEKLVKKLEKQRVEKGEAILTWVLPFDRYISPFNFNV